MRRLSTLLFGALRTEGNPDHGGTDSSEVVFLCIALGVNFRFCRWGNVHRRLRLALLAVGSP
jgi:hypothetical protein